MSDEDDGVIKIPVKRVDAAEDFEALDSSMMVNFAVLGGSDEARVVAGELEGFLIDRMDLLANASDEERHESDEQAFAIVRRLEALGCIVSIGVDPAQLRFDDDPGQTRAWPVGCIAVMLAADEAPFVEFADGQVVSARPQSARD